MAREYVSIRRMANIDENVMRVTPKGLTKLAMLIKPIASAA